MIFQDKFYSVEEFVLDEFPQHRVYDVLFDYRIVKAEMNTQLGTFEIVFDDELEMRCCEAELKKRHRCSIQSEKSPLLKQRTSLNVSPFAKEELSRVGSKKNSYEDIIFILLANYWESHNDM